MLVHIGWSQYFTTERYFEGHPLLTAEAAAYLRDCGVKLVDIDSCNIDDTGGRARRNRPALRRTTGVGQRPSA